MNIQAFNAISSFMAAIWQLFTGWHLPFTNVTPAMLIFFSLIVRLIIKFLNALLSNNPSMIGSYGSDQLRRARAEQRRSND